MALVDLDGHIKPLYGVQKEGADFSYDGRWSYPENFKIDVA
jgi:hypothetical protein